ncbi:Ribosomal RNA small subunit methyltransferase [Actinidia chinensis var. chinensis]|uniref:Ribosomal RNA small subunit methyltransferase n=1 Tax=Actinidia chinensis var. chinensis TaxID=1590841 RepID=A0A2R6QYX9_ACTCC|nr:Ribosomal RNA small subunit methyltransferase [Actinidia chinensis var. chinensis]
MAAAVVRKLLFQSPLSLSSHFSHLRSALSPTNLSTSITTTASSNNRNKNKKAKQNTKAAVAAVVKRRTRSAKEFDGEALLRFGDTGSHIPVMLGEVLDVFASISLRSFVDCTLGAAGHTSAIIQAHPEMQLYIGLDVDPAALEKGQAQINTICHGDSCGLNAELKIHTFLKNYRDIKYVLREVDEKLLTLGVDGILMDLGMSSMQVNNAERGFSVLSNGPLDMRMDPQASLKAEDILNSWPDVEVGRILREYGDESNWYSLQGKIVKARQKGGLHFTGDLVHLIQTSTSGTKGGRQGWIKTATRVFQALRIAVNDELNTLKGTLYACFDCLAPGGRLAVISFHSLEDRIVKQTFLDLINCSRGDEDAEVESYAMDLREIDDDNEAWIIRKIQGLNGTILTKRPITPSQEEEKLNRRSRSAKLRVIQKV